MNADHFEAILQTATNQHRAGNLAEAEKLYRQVLAAVPNHPHALHHLGIIAVQCGKAQVGADLIRRAIAIQPSASALNNLGEALRSLGRLNEGIDCYRKAIALDPRQADAMANLGLALIAAGKSPEAEQSARQALAIAPNHVAASAVVAQWLDKSDRADDAVAAWERVVRLAPKSSIYHRFLGAAWVRAGDPYRAITAFRRAIELHPGDVESHLKLAEAYDALNKSDEAIAAAKQAVTLAPNSWQSHFGLATRLQKSERFEESIAELDAAIKLGPREPSPYGARSSALISLGRIDEAVECLQQGVAVSPNHLRMHCVLSIAKFSQRDYASAIKAAQVAVKIDSHNVDGHASLAFGLLAAGRFDEGFKEYEWRWRDPTFTSKPREFDRPLWDGSDPAGRTILVHCEQGFGDNFQFLRYLPMIRSWGARAVVEVSYKIAGLVRRMSPELIVVVAGTMLPDFDMHVPLLSLPAIFGTTLANIPGTVPYFSSDPMRIAQWRSRLQPIEGLQVGLVWGGNPKPDPKRSIKLAELALLAEIAGISLISLQSSPQSIEADDPPGGMKLKNLGPELRDFSDTTAPLLDNLDLLITIDTGVAHLAAAMAIPTWILIPYSSDWRWVHQDSLSAWYPTVRLFRQTQRDDWASVVERIVVELRTMVLAAVKRPN